MMKEVKKDKAGFIKAMTKELGGLGVFQKILFYKNCTVIYLAGSSNFLSATIKMHTGLQNYYMLPTGSQ